MNTDTPIDFVITWVDGNDPVLAAKRNRYSTKGREFRYEDVASPVRYGDHGEIKYCVASLLKFAPWIRNIFIVTDNQIPPIEDYIKRYFPDHKTQIKIVDHKEIFRGYEQYLPVFNSMSIETMLWRIPGLSENYVYFNDDVFLIRPVEPEVFFEDGKLVMYVRPYSVRRVKWRRFRRRFHWGHTQLKWEYFMVNAAKLLKERHTFPHISHTPHAQKRSLFEAFYAGHQKAMVKNLNCRFRKSWQYNPQVLNYMLAQKAGKAIEKTSRGTTLVVNPNKDQKGIVATRLKEFETDHTAPFCCLNSLDKATEEERRRSFACLRKRLDLEE